MTSAKSPSEFPEMKLRFSVSENGHKLASPYQSVEVAAIVGRTGRPYDVLLYRDQPNVSTVIWGRDKKGIVRIGVHRQTRAVPDDPVNPESKEAIAFTCVPGGYLNRSTETNEVIESIVNAAVREAYEELGLVSAGIKILKVEIPDYPYHNMDPVLYATWSYIAFVEVDLSELSLMRDENLDKDEIIIGMEFMPIDKLLNNIARGRDEFGAYYRATETNSAILIFLANHTEVFKF